MHRRSTFIPVGAAAVILFATGCVADATVADATVADATVADPTVEESDTTGESSTVAQTPIDCWELETRDACLGAPDFELFPHIDDGPIGSCGWVPLYRVVDLQSCELVEDGGWCLGPSFDDGCDGLYGTDCSGGLAAGYAVQEDDTVRVGVGSSSCYTGGLTPCLDDEDSPPECACACSVAELPG